MKKLVLVTGGAGYIGSHAVREFIENDYDCVVLDNLYNGHRETVLADKFEKVDLLDKDALDCIFDKYEIDTVVHFAAMVRVDESVLDPWKYYNNNVIGTLNLLNSMRKYEVKKIIFSSTCATYGEAQYLPLDEKHTQNPINPYGMSKLMCEKIIMDYSKAYGTKYIIFRYFNAAGASYDGKLGCSAHVMTHIIPMVLKNLKGETDKLKIFGNDYNTPDGTCIRDYIHVEDLASAHRLAIEKIDDFSGAINLGIGKGYSVEEIIKAAELVTGKKCKIVYTDRRKGDAAELYANNKLARNVLNWNPKYLSIENIIETAWKWENNRKY